MEINKPYHLVVNDKVYLNFNIFFYHKYSHFGQNDHIYDKMIIIKM